MSLVIARNMVSAEILKLRKKRGTVVWSLLLAVGSIVVYFLYGQLRGNEPAGGMHGFRHGLEVLGIFIGPLAAVLIGAEAGAGDCSAGVFRDLVVTGRSRAALFAARVPGALIVNTAVITGGYLAVVAGTELLSGSTPLPTGGELLGGYGWALLVDGAVCVVAVGLASLTQSRPATITVLVGFELIASPLLLQSTTLGHAREALLDASVLKLVPVTLEGAPTVAESTALALLVLVLWAGVWTALGAWRTLRADA